MAKDKLEVVVAYHRPCSGTSPARTEIWTHESLDKIAYEEAKIRTRCFPYITNRQTAKQGEKIRYRNVNKGLIKEEGVREDSLL